MTYPRLPNGPVDGRRTGRSRWSTRSSRLLAPRLGVAHATVARAWKAYGVQPWRAESGSPNLSSWFLTRPRKSRCWNGDCQSSARSMTRGIGK